MNKILTRRGTKKCKVILINETKLLINNSDGFFSEKLSQQKSKLGYI
jgi:hypothetical protein